MRDDLDQLMEFKLENYTGMIREERELHEDEYWRELDEESELDETECCCEVGEEWDFVSDVEDSLEHGDRETVDACMGEDVAEVSLPIRHRSEQATEGTSTSNHGMAPGTHRTTQESQFSGRVTG